MCKVHIIAVKDTKHSLKIQRNVRIYPYFVLLKIVLKFILKQFHPLIYCKNYFYSKFSTLFQLEVATFLIRF